MTVAPEKVVKEITAVFEAGGYFFLLFSTFHIVDYHHDKSRKQNQFFQRYVHAITSHSILGGNKKKFHSREREHPPPFIVASKGFRQRYYITAFGNCQQK